MVKPITIYISAFKAYIDVLGKQGSSFSFPWAINRCVTASV